MMTKCAMHILSETASRSRMVRDEIHYALYADNGCLLIVTTDPKEAKKRVKQGYRVYCKMLNGDLIL